MIDRVSTDVEKREMKPLNGMTPFKFFAGKLADEEQKFVRNFLPFDSQCARIDFKDKLDNAEKESERIHGYVTEDALNVDIRGLDEYGKADRFKLLQVDEEKEAQLNAGLRTQVVVGYTLKFVCKQRGHGISVFVPVEYYDDIYEKDGSRKKVKKAVDVANK